MKELSLGYLKEFLISGTLRYKMKMKIKIMEYMPMEIY